MESDVVFELLANELKTFTSIKHRAKRRLHRPFASMFKRASCSLFFLLVKVYASKRLKKRLLCVLVAQVIHGIGKAVPDFPLWRNCVYSSEKCSAWPYGQKLGFLGSIPYPRCNSSRKSHLFNVNHISLAASQSATLLRPFLELC